MHATARILAHAGVILALLTACHSNHFPDEATLYAEALARFDIDGDGQMTPDEYARFASRSDSFGAIDADSNGAVDAEEFGAWLTATPPRPEFGGRSTRPLGHPAVHQSQP